MKKILLILLLLNSFVGKGWATDYTANHAIVAAYTMDIDENPIDDVSANSNTGALKGDGTPDFATASPPKVYSTGYYTFATGDYVNCGTGVLTPLTSASSFTIVTWLKTTATVFSALVCSQMAGSTGKGIQLGTGQAASLPLLIRIQGAQRLQRQGNLQINTGSWVHTAATYDGSKAVSGVFLYVAGVSDDGGVTNDLDPGDMTTTNPTFLGVRNTTEIPFVGSMDEVAVFSDVLTITEVNDIMDNGLKPAAGGATDIGTWIM